jgi:hypothetical protein
VHTPKNVCAHVPRSYAHSWSMCGSFEFIFLGGLIPWYLKVTLDLGSG